MTESVPLPDDWQQLVSAARAVRRHAYAPYSQFAVGAALRTSEGQLFSGCNVENASYGLTICAERVAMTRAIASGARSAEVICVSLAGQPSPCGSCRQFLYEFNPHMTVLLDDAESEHPPQRISLQDLLPHGFRLPQDR